MLEKTLRTAAKAHFWNVVVGYASKILAKKRHHMGSNKPAV